MSDSGPQHWHSMGILWSQLGSPLRPSAEDQAGYQTFIRPWIQQFQRPRILILGVTPELYQLPWPQKHDLSALDRSRAMIDEVWPGPSEGAVEGNWLRMPLPHKSHDLSLCDGGLILLEYPGGQRTLVDQLRKLLVPGGRCVFRLFVPPTERQSVEAVLEDFREARLPNLNVLKLRLGMAMQSSPEQGVAVQDILRAVESVDSDLVRLAQRVGWALEHLRVIEAYRGSPARYHFATETQITALFCADNAFSAVGRWQGTYPLSEHCPVVAYQRGED